MKYLILVLKGIAIGIANIIPGVSGGTIAVVFNIYDELVNSITPNIKRLWGKRGFLAPLIFGMAAGILLFSKAVDFLYTNFPLQTDAVFVGLIIGSVPLIVKYARQGLDFGRITTGKRLSFILCALAGFAVLVFFFMIQGRYQKGASPAVLPSVTPLLMLRLLVAGFAGAVAMIIPGISGSLVMLILGMYTTVVTAISALFSSGTALRALSILVPAGIGIVAGLLCGARLISILLKSVPNHTYFVILGLLAGSVVTLFPVSLGGDWNSITVTTCALCVLAGAAISYFCSRTEIRR